MWLWKPAVVGVRERDVLEVTLALVALRHLVQLRVQPVEERGAGLDEATPVERDGFCLREQYCEGVDVVPFRVEAVESRLDDGGTAAREEVVHEVTRLDDALRLVEREEVIHELGGPSGRGSCGGRG